MFFELELGLCERFPALSPISIRRTPAAEVFLLMRRMANWKSYQPKDGKKKRDVIRRPAGDNWF